MKGEFKMTDNFVRIFNTKLKWAHLGSPNTKGDYASGRYEVTITLTPEQAEDLRGRINARQKIKTDKDGDLVITLKSQNKPAVYGADGVLFNTEQADQIGNGTTANVRINIFQSRGMSFAGLSAVRIKDLKIYTGGTGADDLMDEDLKAAQQVASQDLEDDI